VAIREIEVEIGHGPRATAELVDHDLDRTGASSFGDIAHVILDRRPELDVIGVQRRSCSEVRAGAPVIVGDSDISAERVTTRAKD
jgi:hypothetical protein